MNTTNASEFFVAPVRHMKVLSKLARCRICNRLCCCIEHRIKHEKGHYSENASDSVKRTSNLSPRSRNLNNICEKREWLSASDQDFGSHVKRINFPLVCVACKLTIISEHHLTSILNYGPQCSSKGSHWIIPVNKCIGNRRKGNISTMEGGDEKTTLSKKVEESDTSRNTVLAESTPIVSQNTSLSSYQNNLFYSTPQEKFLSHFHLKSFNMSQKNSLSMNQSFCTSTPQEHIESCKAQTFPSVTFTPKCGQNLPGILCNSAEDQKSKGNSLRRVTFSNDLETYIDNESKCSSQRKDGKDQHSLTPAQNSKKFETNKNIDLSDKNSCSMIEKENFCEPLTDFIKITDSNNNGNENLIFTNEQIRGDSSALIGKNKLSEQEKENMKENSTHINQNVERKKINIEDNLRKEDEVCGDKENLVNEKNQETDSVRFTQARREGCESEVEKLENEKTMEELVSPYLSDRCSTENDTNSEASNESDEIFYSGVESLIQNDEKTTKFLDDTTNTVDNENSVSSTVQTNSDDCTANEKNQHTDDGIHCDSNQASCDNSTGKLNFNLSNLFMVEGSEQGPSNLDLRNKPFEDTRISDAHALSEASSSSSKLLSSYSSENLEPSSSSEPSCSFDEACRNTPLLEEDSSLKKIATTLSSSWSKAKIFLSTSLRGKRDNLDCLEEDVENKMPRKKIKLGPSSPEGHNFSGLLKSFAKPQSFYNYKVKGRRPLSRMKKSKPF